MNVIKVKINFKKGTCDVSGIKLITYDYASTVIKFQFDDSSGSNLFTLLDPQNNIVYSDIIQNNEVPLYKMVNVTTEHEGKTYDKYLDDNEDVYWYQPTDEKLYDSEWNEVVSFDLDDYTLVQERGTLFTIKGTYKFEVSKYTNDSKLTSVSGKIGVKNNLVSINDYIAPYISVFDTLMNEVNTLNISVSKVDSVATIVVTKKDGTTETVTISDGDKGDKGDTGTAATINIGTVTTGAAGSSATVTNSGTSSAAVFNFSIPQGVKGENGSNGTNGTNGTDGYSPVATVSKSGTTTTISITDKNGTTSATVNDGSLDYSDQTNKPQINSVTLAGNKSLSDLGIQSTIDSSHKLSADLISDGSTNKTVTSTEKSTWSGKQDALVSGTNIKTINNTSLLGSGNITISGGGGGSTDVQINGTSIVEHAKLLKDMTLQEDVGGKTLVIDTGAYTSSQLVDGIEGLGMVGYFGLQDETSDYGLVVSDGSSLSAYSQYMNVYKPDGTAFGTVDTSHIYVWYMSISVNDNQSSYDGAYVLEDLTTLTNYGDVVFPSNYLLLETNKQYVYPTSVIWNCIKISGYESGFANIETESPYNPNTNKIATMADVGGYLWDGNSYSWYHVSGLTSLDGCVVLTNGSSTPILNIINSLILYNPSYIEANMNTFMDYFANVRIPYANYIDDYKSGVVSIILPTGACIWFNTTDLDNGYYGIDDKVVVISSMLGFSYDLYFDRNDYAECEIETYYDLQAQ